MCNLFICQLVWILNASEDLALYRKYLIKFKKKLFDAVNNCVLISLLKLTNRSNVYRVLLNAGHKLILWVTLFVYIFVYMFIYLECSKWSHPLPFRLFPFRATWWPQRTPTTISQHTHTHYHMRAVPLKESDKNRPSHYQRILSWIPLNSCTKVPLLHNVGSSYAWKQRRGKNDIWGSWRSAVWEPQGN